MQSVLDFLISMGSVDDLLSKRISFYEFNAKIVQIVSSYVMAYSDASNISHFENEMRRVAKEILRGIYAKIFGEISVKNLSEKHAKFLGIDTLDIVQDELVDIF